MARRTESKAGRAKTRKPGQPNGRKRARPARRKVPGVPRPKAVSISDLQARLERKSRELNEAVSQLAATSDVLKVISRSTFDLQSVLDTLTESAARLCNADMAALARKDERGFYHATNYNFPIDWVKVVDVYRLQPGRGSLIGRVLLECKPVQIADVLADAEYAYPEMQKAGGYRTLLGVPLMRGTEATGVLFLGRTTVNLFAKQQIGLISSFADQAVIAIENARLFNETQEALERQTATSDVLKVISRSAFDLRAVLDALLASACRLCKADIGTIRYQENSEYRLAATFGCKPEWIEHFAKYSTRPDRSSVFGRTIIEGHAVHIPDVLADPDFKRPEAQKLMQFRAALGVPLVREGQPFGVINLFRFEVGSFNEKQIELVSTFADQAVIAIQNARLFDEVQARTNDLEEALKYQTASANILNVIASSLTDVGPVLKAIVESACELCGAYDANVLLRVGDYLHFSAHYGPIPSGFDKWALNRNWVTGRSVLDKVPLQVSDFHALEPDEFPEGQLQSRQQGHRCTLSVPMLREDEAIGAIVLRRFEPHPFNEKQIGLLRTFADQAVIAIGNVRLFEELQAKTRDLQESLQQQTATADVLKVISRSTFDLPAVLQTLVESAARLCDADRTNITREKNGVFYRAEGFGFSREFQEYARSNPINPGRGSAFGRALVSGEVVHIADVLADPEYTYREGQRLGNYRTVLAVPMLREGTSIGVLSLTRSEVRPFTDKQLELARTFADQASIAIENVRLFDQLQTRTKDLATSLDELRSAQDRLVQTEKLASLGQLTAGIAHEIKNPLNFVNNFSALSVELTDELKDVLNQAALADGIRAEVDELTNLLKDNLGRVVQHGKRADSIVKNMLLHSREGSGEQRVADINGIIEDSLNLAYHGARAERPGFNITLERDLDPAAGEIELYPQEITRALLNLISNGFYAASKRAAEAGDGFEPVVKAVTRSFDDCVEIRIRDNGIGIPEEIKAKIFNPFFTTKPAGEGTGLGLSMSHDIIVKQHGGTIRVDTETGVFTEFILTLPRAASAQNRNGAHSEHVHCRRR